MLVPRWITKFPYIIDLKATLSKNLGYYTCHNITICWFLLYEKNIIFLNFFFAATDFIPKPVIIPNFITLQNRRTNAKAAVVRPRQQQFIPIPKPKMDQFA